MDLYVSSISTGALQRSPGLLFHSCDLKETKTFTFYSEEDHEAIKFLTEKGVTFNLVDLSKCSFIVKMKAKFAGINRTPTLVLDDGTKLRGIKQIKEHFSK